MKYLLLILAVWGCCYCHCQTLQEFNKDSLLQLLPKAKEDTNKVFLLLKAGSIYEHNKPDSSKYFYQQAGDLSKKLNYAVGTLKYISYYTAILNIESKYDESLRMNLSAVSLAQKINNPVQLAVAYCNAGASYYGLKGYTSCADYFLKAEGVLTSINDSQRLVLVYGNLTGLYNELNEHEKGFAYGLKAIALSRQLHDDYALSEALENAAQSLTDLKRYDTALIMLKEAGSLAVKLDDKLMTGAININNAEIYYAQGRYAELKQASIDALAAAKEVGDKDVIGKAFVFLGRCNFFAKDYAGGTANAKAALAVSDPAKIIEVSSGAYSMLSDVALASGNLAAFKKFRDVHDSLEDVMVSQQIIKNSQDIEAKYSLAKKEAQISSLNDEKQIQGLTIKQGRIINVALAITLVILGIAGFLFYRNIQNKRKLLSASAALQQQRIAELEIEKQFLAAQAVLKGQEEERGRLAKDLHDGLGGILSGAKYAFGNMKSNFIITPESAEAFDKSMAMLDRSISELRAVSHNMMPEALMKFGLSTALKDYCSNMQQNSALQITYQAFEVDEESIAKSTASVIYRIIQELLNNIVKHAEAKTVLVQLVQNENGLSITVEDDGKGFEKDLLQMAEGIGFRNIYNRVNYLKGTIDFETTPGRGTSVTIEIPNLA